jgi:putative photosynthetic complex assembly protein
MIVREYEKDEITVHKVPLMLMGGIIAISLALTASVTLGFLPKQSVPSEARAAAGIGPAQERSLRFFDEPDGTVRVEDGATGEVLARHGVGQGGFIRATVRSLVHQRRIRNIGPETAFTLTEWQNGNLTLADPATGRSVEVSSFGPDNRAVYQNLLPVKEAIR